MSNQVWSLRWGGSFPVPLHRARGFWALRFEANLAFKCSMFLISGSFFNIHQPSRNLRTSSSEHEAIYSLQIKTGEELLGRSVSTNPFFCVTTLLERLVNMDRHYWDSRIHTSNFVYSKILEHFQDAHRHFLTRTEHVPGLWFLFEGKRQLHIRWSWSANLTNIELFRYTYRLDLA